MQTTSCVWEATLAVYGRLSRVYMSMYSTEEGAVLCRHEPLPERIHAYCETELKE